MALQDLALTLENNKAEIVQRKDGLIERQKEVARLATERTHMEKLENQAKSVVKNKDKHIEVACRQ